MKRKHLFQAACVTAVAATMVVQTPATQAQFYDVTAGTEAAEAIQKLTALKITNGYLDGTFQPKKSVTRAEAAKMLTVLHLNGAPVPESTTRFKDVSAGHWAEDYVAYAKDHEWLQGYADGTFKLDEVVTRAQFAKILSAYLGSEVPNVKLPFQDVIPGAWYEDGVKVLLDLNITTGTSATTFSPFQPITREQFAIFLDRAKLLAHAPELPEMTVKPEQPSNVSLAALANPNKVYDAVTMNRLLQSLSTTEWATIESFNSNAPFISRESNEIYDVVPGTYNYKFIRNWLEPLPQAEYILRVTFDEVGVTSFKVYTAQQFEQVVNNASGGPQQLSAYINDYLKKASLAEVRMTTSSNMSISNAKLSDKTWYIERYDETPVVIRVGYLHTGAADSVPQFYELSSKWNGEATAFSLKPISPIQTFTFPKGYDEAYISHPNPGVAGSEGVAYYSSPAGFVTLYAINEQNDPVKVGTEIVIEYNDFQGTFEDWIKEYYVYDGQKFVKK